MGYGRWHEFEELDDEAMEELDAIFSDDALKENVYGISDQLHNADVDGVLETLYREWRRGARIRKDEVGYSVIFKRISKSIQAMSYRFEAQNQRIWTTSFPSTLSDTKSPYRSISCSKVMSRWKE